MGWDEMGMGMECTCMTMQRSAMRCWLGYAATSCCLLLLRVAFPFVSFDVEGIVASRTN